MGNSISCARGLASLFVLAAGILTLPACTPPTQPPAQQSARSAAPASARLVEHLETERNGQRLVLTTVDGQLRYAHEILKTARGSQAANTWLYFEEQPVYYRSSGTWPDQQRDHAVSGWAEFSVTGALLGLEKRLDGERVPIGTGEPAAIVQGSLDLFRQARPLLVGHDNCGYNKTLRWQNHLVTLNTGSGKACGPGQLQIFIQAPGGTRSQPLERTGSINDSWLRDFDNDGEPELLIEFEDPQAAQSLLRGWRIQGTQLKALSLGEPCEADRENYRGGDRYYVHGQQLICRFPTGKSLEGLPLWQRLQYNWRAGLWAPASAPARNGLPEMFTGQWRNANGDVLELLANGNLHLTSSCGEITGSATRFPGNILLIALAPPADAECAAKDTLRHGLAGFWFAEIVNGRLRLASLEHAEERIYTAAGFARSSDTL